MHAASAPTPAPARGTLATSSAPHLGAPDPGGQRLAGVVTMFGSGLSNQTGAAIGSLAFPVLGPIGVVAVRQYVAAIVLMAVGRPRPRTFTKEQWWPVLLLALVFGTMNLSLYSAIDRIGLGLAVTLEFLGPLRSPSPPHAAVWTRAAR
ncbi:membrane protein [Streptomyces purpurascens]